MKYFFALLALLMCFSLSAQSVEITQDAEGNYFLTTVEVSENGTDSPDTVKTTSYLSDSTGVAQAIRNIDATWANEDIRLLRRIQALNQDFRSRQLNLQAVALGVNLDSLNDAAYIAPLLVDTMRLVLFTNRLSDSDLAAWTSEANPPNLIRLDIEAGLRPNGTYRIDFGLGGTQRIKMLSSQSFELVSVPGLGQFYLESESEDRMYWRTENIGNPYARIISFKTARNRAPSN